MGSLVLYDTREPIFIGHNMTTKKRIFIANDASYLDTGYGIYGKEILTRLHNSDKYEVAELGCYATKESIVDKKIPWKFYPNAVTTNDPLNDSYKSSVLNQFGSWKFNAAILDFKPHIVFDIRDYWMFAYQETSPFKDYFHWIIMPATDSSPPKIDWLFTYANADMIMPYTLWAQKTLSNYGRSQLKIFDKIANAGINPNEFFILPNKNELKEGFFDIQKPLVTGLVMRNQKRKLFAEIIITYKKYLEALKTANLTDTYHRSILYLHTSYPEENGWDLPALLLEHGMLDKTYFSYICKACHHFAPSKFQGSIKLCPKCGNRSSCIPGPNNGVPTSTLNIIYNLFDIFIQYAICEGFGMPQIEAAACGLQIASVDYSAMTEICDNLSGIKIPVAKSFRELETNADRVYPDNNFTTKMLYDFFVNTSEEEKITNSFKIRELCIERYTWDNVYRVWDECFDAVDIHRKKPWTSKTLSETHHEDRQVPNSLTNKDFVRYICNEIINTPSLFNTAMVQAMIRDLDSGLVARNGTSMIFDRNKAVELLNGLLSNKIFCEKNRIEKL